MLVSSKLNVERNKAFIGTLKRTTKVVRKIKMRESEIFFSEIGKLEKLEVYSDAGFCFLPDGISSTQGQGILLRGHKQCCVLDLSSVKIKRKVSSTLEAEALSLKCNLRWFIAVRIYFWRLKRKQIES